MKFSNISALAALFCTAAGAQTASPATVTFYGMVDMSASYQSRLISPNGTRRDGSLKNLDSGGSNGSRWGVRGREDLGGGHAAIFLLESGLQADTGVQAQGGRAFGRQAYAGIDGPYGKLTLGRHYSPYFDTLSFGDAFGNNLVGNSGNLSQANPRIDNSVLYVTPSFAGVRGQLLVAAGEGGPAGRQIDVNLSYTGGPLWVSATHVEIKAAIDAKLAVVGASYDFQVVKLFAHYVKLDNVKPASDAASPAATAAPVLVAGAKGRSWHLGAMAPLGSGRLFASYVRLDDQRAADRDAAMVALGYVYDLSKRTSFYAAGARIRNENGGVMVVSTPSNPGAGEQQLQLGMTHRF